MDRKHLPKPPASLHPLPRQAASKGKPNASKHHAQVDTLLRTKKVDARQKIADKVKTARHARTPAAMIAALDHIRPLGHQLATSAAGKVAWDAAITKAHLVWQAVKLPARETSHDGATGEDAQAPTTRGGLQGGPRTTKGGGAVLDSEYIDVISIAAPPAPFAPFPIPSAKTIAIAKQAGADVGDAAHAGGNAAADAAQDAGEAAQDAAEDAKDAAQDAADQGADAARDGAEEGASHAEDAANEASSTVAGWFHH